MADPMTQATTADGAAMPSPALSNPADEQPREFLRGWRILLLALAGAATTASVTLLYGFGTLVVPLQNAFGWSRADLQVTIAFMSGGVVVASQLAGWAMGRWGMRRMVLFSLPALALALLAITQISGSIGWLYLGFFLAPIAGVGITFVTWTQLVSHWFDRSRGLALAIVLCGSGITAAVLPPLITAAIEHWDWRAGFVVLAALPLLLALPLAWRLLQPYPPAAPASGRATPEPAKASANAAKLDVNAGLPSTFRTSVRSRKFWVLNLALTLVVSAVVGMVTNTVPLLRDIGLSATDASRIFSSFGFALISGRLLAGWLIDRLWAPGVAAVTLSMPAIGCALLWQADAATAMPVLLFAVGLIGVGAGAEFDLSAYLVSRYFGLADYARLFGIHLGLITAGSVLGPLMFAAMYRSAGGYGPLLAYCTAVCVFGPLLLLTLGSAPSRQSQAGSPHIETNP